MAKLPKIHHLIRYFVGFAVIAFGCYIKQILYEICLLFLGPALYIAQALKKIVITYVWALPSSEAVNYYVFLLPVTLFYYGLAAFQLKQLWNERGKVRVLSLAVFSGFLIYVHFTAWQHLMGYFGENP